METKKYYIVTSGMGPITINRKIEEGYKIIGRFKLMNPQPRLISMDDVVFIKSKLPEWLKEHNSCGLTEIDSIEYESNLMSRLNYVFTLCYLEQYLEIDFYLLQIPNGNGLFNVYVGKGSFINSDSNFKIEEELLYPFFDEEWHQNYDDPTLYEPGDLW